MRFRFGLACMLVAAAAEAAPLCDRTEQVIFSCSVKGSAKTISLCASPSLTRTAGHLQYRFGQPGRVELEFPQEKRNSPKAFRYAHYFRAQVDRTEVSFDNGGYQYAIFNSYEGEQKPIQRASGVSVKTSDNKAKERLLVCAPPVTNKLVTLEDVIPCDADNALNMGSCR